MDFRPTAHLRPRWRARQGGAKVTFRKPLCGQRSAISVSAHPVAGILTAQAPLRLTVPVRRTAARAPVLIP
jgi:hypothetical protein